MLSREWGVHDYACAESGSALDVTFLVRIRFILMPSASVQFHATDAELAQFVESVLVSVYPGRHCIGVAYFPFVARVLPPTGTFTAFHGAILRRVVLTHTAPVLGAAGNLELLDANPGALVLELGRLGARGLEETYLSTTASAEWKRAIALLKLQTSEGAGGTSDQTGATAKYRAHRFSKGARDLLSAGVALRPFATSPVLLRPDDNPS